MPLPYLEKLAKKNGISMKSAEAAWEKAKARAAEQGHGENYAYITGIVKRMLGETDSGLSKVIRGLIEDIRSGRMDADEAASMLAETVTSGSVGGFIAGGLLPRGNKWDREGSVKPGGAHKDAFPTGTRDPKTGIPNIPAWGNAGLPATTGNARKGSWKL